MIDWDRVAELRAEIGEDDMPDVVALFLEEAEDVLARLVGGRMTEAEVARALHALKGAALNLGLADLASLCAAAEADAGGPALAQLSACYAESRRTLEQAMPEIRAA